MLTQLQATAAATSFSRSDDKIAVRQGHLCTRRLSQSLLNTRAEAIELHAVALACVATIPELHTVAPARATGSATITEIVKQRDTVCHNLHADGVVNGVPVRVQKSTGSSKRCTCDSSDRNCGAVGLCEAHERANANALSGNHNSPRCMHIHTCPPSQELVRTQMR